MASLGDYLRQARERRGVSLDDVARVTRIRRQHLEALETDRLGDLPAPPFVRGFLSAYAKQVGLPADEVLARFEAVRGASAQAGGTAPAPARRESGGPHGPARPVAPSPSPARALPAAPHSSPARPERAAPHGSPQRSVLVLVALVGLGALAVLGSILARPAAPPVRPIAAPVPVHTPAVAVPSPVAAVEVAPAASPVATPAATVAATPAAPRPLPARPAAAQSDAQPVRATPAALPGVPAAPAVATVPARRSTLSVSATEEAWVQVTIDGGTPVEASLKPGDRVSWQGGSFDVVVGNAGGVALEVDGVLQPPLGESGRRATVRLPRQAAQ